jgi:hypothetical protein
MGIIVNIQNNIVVIYGIKSFYVTLAVAIYFANIYIEQLTILPLVKKMKKKLIMLPYYRWVILCTVKDIEKERDGEEGERERERERSESECRRRG